LRDDPAICEKPMMTAHGSRELLKRATERLARAGISQPLFEAQLLLGHCLGVERHLLAIDDRPVSEDQIRRFNTLIQRRLGREPMAYIIGTKEFWSLDFKVGPGVLVPRPETETLVEAVLGRFERSFNGRILDLGCGSGILSVVLAREFPGAKVVAVDRSATALDFTAANCRRHGVCDRVSLIRGDWCEPLAGPFDVVVANPPYVAEEDRDTLEPELSFEPETALFAGQCGLRDIERILESLAVVLAPQAYVFMEIGFGQSSRVLEFARGCGWCRRAEVVSDLAGVPRVLVAEGGEVKSEKGRKTEGGMKNGQTGNRGRS